jgi:thioesterase domain-containing protein
MRSVQPHGPYYIGGMCGGARIAFDIARLLEAEGQEVRLLSIFDTWVVENSQRRFLWYFHYYYQRLQKFGSLPKSQKREMFLSAFRKKLRKLSGRVENVEKSLWRQSYWPGKEFELPKYHGRITLFKIPKQPFYYVRDPLMGWGNRTTGRVDVEFIRSEHLKLLRQPYVQELGRKLSECLERARGDAYSGSIVQVSLPSSYASGPSNGTPGTEDNFASVVDDQADE